MKVVYWGTYDKGKPRNRILIRGLRDCGVEVLEVHYNLWAGVEDKSQVTGIIRKVIFLMKWFFHYPKLVYQFLTSPPCDAVVVGYLGQLDVLIIWLFAKIKRTPLIWDAFISLHDTIVSDRKLIGRYNPVALLIYGWEFLSCRASDLVLLDTDAHAQFFIDHYKLPRHKVKSVFVGVEPEVFPRADEEIENVAPSSDKELSVLFYGQFIPLHGIHTIIQAAYLLKDESINWYLIGQGQEGGKIEQLLRKQPVKKLNWKKWVKYEDLIQHIHDADICLGIFGSSDKASRVIPNKVFQIVSSGKPVITRDSPAIRELFMQIPEDTVLIPPSSPKALSEAVLLLKDRLNELPTKNYIALNSRIRPETIGREFRWLIEKRSEQLTGDTT